MRFLTLFLSLVLVSPIWADELFYPQQQTLAVARVKSVGALAQAYDDFKTYFLAQSALSEFFTPVLADFKKFDLRATLATELGVSRADFDKSFSGEVVLIVDNKIPQEGVWKPTVALVVTPETQEGADGLAKIIESSNRVAGKSSADGAVDGVRKLELSQSAPKNGEKPLPPKYFYLLEQANRVWLSNSADFLTSCVQAQSAGFCPDFFRQANESDVSVWLDPQPIVEYARARLAARSDPQNPDMLGPDIIDKLGLNEAQGIGLSLDLAKKEGYFELQFDPKEDGIFSLIGCAPSGLDPSPLIPDTVQEFTLGRFDMECLWSKFKELAGAVMPASDAIYRGWQTQILNDYGVAVDRQLFGTMGTRYMTYDAPNEQGGVSTVVFLELRDCVAFEKALNAVLDFFAQGKTYFDTEKVGGLTVRRLKGEFQSDAGSSLSFAVSPKWLILCVGSPAEIGNVADDLHKTSRGKIWTPTVLADMNERGEELVTFGYRSAQSFWEEMASAALEVDYNTAERNQTKPLWNSDTVPDFSAINGSLTYRLYHNPGLLTAILKFNENK